MMYKFIKPVSCFIATLVLLSGCQRELSTDPGASGSVFSLNVQFKPVVDAAPLQFNTSYRNFFGESYSVQAFKFYVYGIDLVDTDDKQVLHLGADYFLINAADPQSTVLQFSAPARKYNRIDFTLGVDSARNVSGAQTGALDPANGMFWTWNSGYIMAKLEGTSPSSTQPNNKFEYHIGGFKDPVSVVKRISLPFPPNGPGVFLPGTTATIDITANLDTWFHQVNDLRITTNPVCMTPGVLSQQIADNYSKMFAVADVTTN